MPGIVGLVTKKPREEAEQELLRMVTTTRHESFYGTGTWSDESLGVYVGWTVQESSFADRMPICNERKDIVLVFAGEEFPKPDLGAAGLSYLVNLYEEDPAFPAGLNGRFQGLLADRARRTITLFNDRYGMHRIYYYEAKDAFYFAAEAKAILAVRPELRAVDPRGLGELISCGCVLEDRTIFQGIRLVPSAAAWVFRDGAIQKRRTYFQAREWEDQAPLEPESYY